MDIRERMELEAEQNARWDYLYEAFGAEARLLEAQARDEDAENNGFTSYHAAQAAWKEQARRRRASESIRRGKDARDPSNDVPF